MKAKRQTCTATRHGFVRAWWGTRENPGCWDTGNGAIKTVSVCRHCGCYRTEVSSYCGRTGDDKVTYTPGTAAEAREATRRHLERRAESARPLTPEMAALRAKIEALPS